MMCEGKREYLYGKGGFSSFLELPSSGLDRSGEIPDHWHTGISLPRGIRVFRVNRM